MNQNVVPLLPKMTRIIASSSIDQSRKKVFKLYKKYLRHIPAFMIRFHTLPLSYKSYHDKIKEEFMKNKDVKDIRIIDMLLHQGEMDYKDILFVHKQGCHIMNYFHRTEVPKPKDFMGKFMSGTSAIN